MPRVSVLMPVYNTKEEYLQEAIESILNQTYTNFELLIMDDGSTNQDTLDILKFYKTRDNRIKIYFEKHIGIVKIRNKLLELARGEYLAIMDSDDISLPYRLEKEVDFLDNNKDISIVGSWFECFPKYQIIKLQPYPKILDFIKGNCVGHSTIMFGREEFENYDLKYNEIYEAAQDYGLWAEAVFKMNFANIQQVLVKYRVHPDNITHTKAELQQNNAKKIQQSMLENLTDDKLIQQKILDILNPCCEQQKVQLKPNKKNYWEKIFSVKNDYSSGVKYKVVTIMGFKIKFRQESLVVVKLMGGLGNQMFQYTFGKSLELKTNMKVLFDDSWFTDAKNSIVNEKNENSQGVIIRNYNLNIFNNNINFIPREQIRKCKKHINQKNAFLYDSNLFKKQKNVYYEGYFQNEKYFSSIKDFIKNEFSFPKILPTDVFNQEIIQKIQKTENSVFIHIRRGDYLNLADWALPTEYYKKAILYINTHVKNPSYFIFGQDCEEYVKTELNLDIPYTIIGNTNSNNNEDWKDMVLMEKCKHAIVANSSFSWWAAWLGKANSEGIVVAPTPWLHEDDDVICDNWVKIER